MINRKLYKYLQNWKDSPTQRPLILRGARQVGKTTLVDLFGKEYDQYVYLNLERKPDLELFKSLDTDTVIELLFLNRGLINDAGKTTLIFIDEVQQEPRVIEMLRYFYEDHGHLDVIATGSLLDFALDKVQRVPVGRVSYAELHPLSFDEYIGAKKNKTAQDLMEKIPFDNKLLGPIYDLFHEYVLIGGMPGIVDAYLKEQDLSRVKHLYSDIIESYKSDVEKYASNDTQKRILRHIMEAAPYEIDNRINLNAFGNSSYKTREVKEAMQALEKARLLSLMYPTTQVAMPLLPDYKKRPRLQFLDIGLVNFQLGLHPELLTIDDLHDSSRGKLIQQVVLQELTAIRERPGKSLHFWVRDKKGTSSEVDVLYPHQNMVIPIEVKSGATGRLRSLHEYMDRCDHSYAVRIYKGDLRIDPMTTRKGKPYQLLNLPYCFCGQIEGYLDWFLSQ